jgi:hypothetical protein
MSVKFNDAYFQKLGTSSEVTQKLVTVANRAAASAKANSPIESGAYVGGIVVRVKRNANLVNVALVVATDPKSLIIESKYGPLAKGLGAVKGG